MRRLVVLVPLLACGASQTPAEIPPVTSAPVGPAPATTPTASAAEGVHVVRAQLERSDGVVFLIHRGEKASTCEKGTIKPTDKPGRRTLGIDASSPMGCWSGAASIAYELDGDRADFSETRISGQYMGHVTRCMSVAIAGQPPAPNVIVVSPTELRIDGVRMFADEGACKAAIPTADEVAPTAGCLAKGIEAGINERRPPPRGAFVERFDALVKNGGTVYIPSDTKKGVCNAYTVKTEQRKDADLDVNMTRTFTEKGAKTTETSTYVYKPICKRTVFRGMHGEVENADGTKSGFASASSGNETDLHEQEETKDALPIQGPVFYSQAPCITYSRANPPTP